MSEMLGNQYFMARNFVDAVKEFEPIFLKDSSNKAICRKLIIGYTQIGELNKALELFISLVKKDVNFIIKADPIFDDCPCPEIIEKSPFAPTQKESVEANIYNGILWLYCNPELSVQHLTKLIKYYPEIKATIQTINNSINDNTKLQ